ncbi:MAG: Uma2 family endonuclease [bacterium]
MSISITKSAYQPDIIFISNENKDIIKKKGVDVPPDLVIEILSPSNEYYDIKIKKEVYEKSGVLEYIIIVYPGASYCIL